MSVQVSVAMGVYNGAGDLARTIDSVLAQDGVEFELVAVDDGSSDSSAAILDDYAARDARVRVLHRPNRGLTRALIEACALASGPLIARQDVGDISLPGRLATQAALLQARPDVAFVACRCALVGPCDEPLSNPTGPSPSPENGLENRQGRLLPSPHHGTVMFRRSAYESAGGYRPEFYFAQDVDLWSRLIEVGDFDYLPDVLYESRFSLDGITARHRPEQQQLRSLIEEAAKLRRTAQTDADVLRRAAAIRPSGRESSRADRSSQRAAAAYFVGSCLAQRGDPRARPYLLAAIREKPLHLRGWYKLLRMTLPTQRVGADADKP